MIPTLFPVDGVSFLQNCNIEPSNYRESPFEDFNHVLTWDLRIINNGIIFASIGSKYREKNLINFHEAGRDILKSVDDCISTWCKWKIDIYYKYIP